MVVAWKPDAPIAEFFEYLENVSNELATLRADNEQLQTENERLRQALKEIEAMTFESYVEDIARVALATTDEATE